MGRASEAQKAERLNRARILLRQTDQLPEAVERLARDCSISSATSVSIPAASAKVERAGSCERAKAGVHGQASTQLDSARAVVRICQENLNQRSREPGTTGAPATRRRSWLSRSQSRHARFGWNIDLTACWPTNWLKRINCWYPTGDGRLQGRPLNHTMLIRR